MYYTAQDLIDIPDFPVNSIEDIKKIIDDNVLGNPTPPIFNNFVPLFANSTEGRNEDLFFPSYQDREDYYNE